MAEMASVPTVPPRLPALLAPSANWLGSVSAIASSSLATEWLKGKSVDEAETIKNSMIAEELNLPPVKIHCSVLAEDAIKSAIQDFRAKQAAKRAL